MLATLIVLAALATSPPALPPMGWVPPATAAAAAEHWEPYASNPACEVYGKVEDGVFRYRFWRYRDRPEAIHAVHPEPGTHPLLTETGQVIVVADPVRPTAMPVRVRVVPAHGHNVSDVVAACRAAGLDVREVTYEYAIYGAIAPDRLEGLRHAVGVSAVTPVAETPNVPRPAFCRHCIRSFMATTSPPVCPWCHRTLPPLMGAAGDPDDTVVERLRGLQVRKGADGTYYISRERGAGRDYFQSLDGGILHRWGNFATRARFADPQPAIALLARLLVPVPFTEAAPPGGDDPILKNVHGCQIREGQDGFYYVSREHVSGRQYLLSNVALDEPLRWGDYARRARFYGPQTPTERLLHAAPPAESP